LARVCHCKKAVAVGLISCKLNRAFGGDCLPSVGLAEGDSMRPKERRDSGQNDLFRARLDKIDDMGHPLAKLG
jgi:hypothetical protein